jgi:hypothetical protein
MIDTQTLAPAQQAENNKTHFPNERLSTGRLGMLFWSKRLSCVARSSAWRCNGVN